MPHHFFEERIGSSGLQGRCDLPVALWRPGKDVKVYGGGGLYVSGFIPISRINTYSHNAIGERDNLQLRCTKMTNSSYDYIEDEPRDLKYGNCLGKDVAIRFI